MRRLPGLSIVIFSGILFPLIQGCMKEEAAIDFSAEELTRLISGDSTKTWVRVRQAIDGTDSDLDPCDLKLLYQFSVIGTSGSDKTYNILRNTEVCSNQDSLVSGDPWELTDEKSGTAIKDSLQLISGQDTSRYGIYFITSMSMKLTKRTGEKVIENDFEIYNP